MNTVPSLMQDFKNNTKENIDYIFTQPYDLHKVEESGDLSPKYCLEVSGCVYYIGIYIYLILTQIKLGRNFNAIWKFLNAFHKQENIFSKEEVAKAINQDIRPLFDAKQKKTSRVKSLFKILNPSSIKVLIDPLSFLFQDRLFKVLFTILLVVNGGYYILIKTIAPIIPTIGHTSMQESLIYVFGIICCLIFHEIGHAVAAIAKNITPKKIGFGIYFIFPALYTDLTDTWRLNSRDRIIINLGGIYFQLLINSIFILWLLQLPNTDVLSYYLHKIVILNILISIYNINPFFKFDGYWIYSDYFDIPNLRQQSNKVISQFFMYVKNWFKGNTLKQVEVSEKNYPLTIYAILYVCFMSFVWLSIIKFIVNTHIKLFDVLANLETFNTTGITGWANLIPLILFASIPWVITFFRIHKHLKTKRNEP